MYLLQTSAAEPYTDANNTVYTDVGAESVDLSCGEVPKNAGSIQWSVKKSKEWERILKFDHNNTNTAPRYYNSYSAEKYKISESVHTSLVVKNIELSDVGLFQCITRGAHVTYSYTTSLKVVGK